MNIIHQAGIVFINHCQLVPGCAHIQTAHSCRLLQQDDCENVIDKYLQDLDTFETNVSPSIFVPKTRNSVAGTNSKAV